MMYLCVGGELGKYEERDFSSFRKLVFPRKLTRIRTEPINVELSTENLSENSRQWKMPIFPNSKKSHWKGGYVQKQGERLFFNKLVSWQLKICVKCAQNVFFVNVFKIVFFSSIIFHLLGSIPPRSVYDFAMLWLFRNPENHNSYLCKLALFRY